MARAGAVTLEFYPEQFPVIPGAEELARMGLVPAGAYRNREFVKDELETGGAQDWEIDLFTDPQTSGGLLFSLDERELKRAEQALEQAGLATPWAVIGRVLAARKKKLIIR